MTAESCADRVLRLHAEYVAWKSVRKWSAGPAETRDVSEFCAKRMDAIRTEAIAAVRLQMAEIENMKRTRGMEHWAIQGDVSDALDTLSKYAWTKAKLHEESPKAPERVLKDWSKVLLAKLPFSTRTSNLLARHGFVTVQDVLDKGVESLCRYPGVGRRVVMEVDETFKAKGVTK